MLVQFTVENFMSFKEETTFSMIASAGDQHSTHVVADAAGKGKSVLRAAAIYGANAAGKSNLIHAIKFAQDLIQNGTRSGQSLCVPTFKLGNYSKHPSKFDFVFTHQGVLYSYGFKLNSTQILEEWLYATAPGKHETVYFERGNPDEKGMRFEFGTPLKGRSKKQAQFLEFVAQGTRPNQLFLTEAIDRNSETLAPIFDWFKSVLVIISAESQYKNLEMTVYKGGPFTSYIGNLLETAGTGIQGIETEEIPLDFDRHFPGMPESLKTEFLAKIRGAEENEGFLVHNDSAERCLVTRSEQGTPALVQLKTQHTDEEGRIVNFSMEEESEGTQRLIHLTPALYALREEKERVVFLDELDRRLHPLLSRLLVQAALDCKEGNKQNQLIFTTHDTNLLDQELLRRDEIWFVEKDKQGASHLYSLAEFKVRPDLQLQKGYLNGRFGAIPFIGDLCKLGLADTETQNIAA